MEKVKYQKLWACMHDNPHHNQIDDLNTWYEHMKKIYDFWPIAYYPFGIVPTETGFGTEELLSEDKINADWEIIRQLVKRANREGYPMFMGYEWQGSGEDGDHNVFFFDNDENPAFPLRYRELVERYKGIQAIGIPHHLAYQLGFRGKNWATQDDQFSPFVEIGRAHV